MDSTRSLSRSFGSVPVSRRPERARKNYLERALSVFADVRAGEGALVLLLCLNVFLLLAAYYVLKTVREELILSESSAEVKTYSAAGQAILLAILIPVYSRFASRVNRSWLIQSTTLFFLSHLAIFFCLGRLGLREGVAFFLWVGVFNVFVVSQFWAMANDLFTEAQGKRLFPIVGIGSSIGALAGASAAEWLARGMNPYSMMLVAAAVLASTMGVTYLVTQYRLQSRFTVQPEGTSLSKTDAFRLIFQKRYLILIALLVVLLNIVNTTGEFMLSKLVAGKAVELAGAGASHAAARQKIIGTFYADYFMWVNLLVLGIQALAVSRIFQLVGIRGALFVLPVVAMGGYAMISVAPILTLIRGVKIAENALDYSLQNTTKEALFLSTTRDEKYKAKVAIDSFFWRFGDVLQAGIVYLGSMLALGISGFAKINIVLTGLWLVVVYLISRENRRFTESPSQSQPDRLPATNIPAAEAI